jgi:zinc protease
MVDSSAKEIHTAPIISTGCGIGLVRAMRRGGNGLAHWVEHMQFKGTPTFPTSMLDKAISREGGV